MTFESKAQLILPQYWRHESTFSLMLGYKQYCYLCTANNVKMQEEQNYSVNCNEPQLSLIL